MEEFSSGFNLMARCLLHQSPWIAWEKGWWVPWWGGSRNTADGNRVEELQQHLLPAQAVRSSLMNLVALRLEEDLKEEENSISIKQ